MNWYRKIAAYDHFQIGYDTESENPAYNILEMEGKEKKRKKKNTNMLPVMVMINDGVGFHGDSGDGGGVAEGKPKKKKKKKDWNINPDKAIIKDKSRPKDDPKINW